MPRALKLLAPDASSPSPTAALDGVLSASAQLAAGELTAALLPGGRSLVSGLGRTLIDALPGLGVDMVVATAETLDKPLLKASLATALLGVGGAAGVADGRRPRTAFGLFAGTGLLAGAAAASRRDAATGSSLAAGVVGGIAGTGSLALLKASSSRTARRSVTLLAAGAGVAAVRLRGGQHARLLARRAAITLPPAKHPADPVPAGASFPLPGLTPLFTPTGSFYVTDVQLPAPQIDPDKWRLRVHGMVGRELNLSLAEILAMDLVEIDATLACVHNPVGGNRISSARWLGLPLARILELSGAEPDAEQLVARSVDGFTAGIPTAHIRGGAPALLAVGMNGEPLPIKNGFPARTLIPGLWGADANTKWVIELELTTWGAVRDYWDRRGWPRQPTAVRPGSRIDLPANRALLPVEQTTVAGVAWAPAEGVERVEVAVDDRPWEPAQLSAEVAPTMWRQCRLQWEPTPGPHTLAVRTIGRRATQKAEPQPPYPTGASGYHSVRVSAAGQPRRPANRFRVRTAPAWDDLAARARLAAMAPAAWRRQGFPPSPRFPAPLEARHRAPVGTAVSPAADRSH